MRKGSVSRSSDLAPLPAGGGFLFLAAALFIAAPAQAAPVGVTLKVNAGAYAGSAATCAVSVPAGADGVAVLEAALQSGCIAQYKVETFSFGKYVSCIDYVCDVPWRLADVETGAEFVSPVYWAMRVDGACAPYGVSDFEAAAGGELSFTFTTWLPALADETYCSL